MIFKYSQSLIHQFPGLNWETNIMTSSQLACWLSWQNTALVLQRPWIQIPYRPEFFSGLIFTSALEVFITANIAFLFKIIFIFVAKTIWYCNPKKLVSRVCMTHWHSHCLFHFDSLAISKITVLLKNKSTMKLQMNDKKFILCCHWSSYRPLEWSVQHFRKSER